MLEEKNMAKKNNEKKEKNDEIKEIIEKARESAQKEREELEKAWEMLKEKFARKEEKEEEKVGEKENEKVAIEQAKQLGQALKAREDGAEQASSTAVVPILKSKERWKGKRELEEIAWQDGRISNERKKEIERGGKGEQSQQYEKYQGLGEEEKAIASRKLNKVEKMVGFEKAKIIDEMTPLSEQKMFNEVIRTREIALETKFYDKYETEKKRESLEKVKRYYQD
ncbi:MAG: hypothetical protein QW244_02965 [Candidatus Pacearchaeota archaeon]